MKNIKILTKIIAAFIFVAFFVGFAIRLTSQYSASLIITDMTKNNLSSYSELNADKIENYMDSYLLNLKSLANTKNTINIINSLHKYYRKEERVENEDFPINTNEYNDIYSKHSEIYKQFRENYKCEDILIICKKHGHVMFSLQKSNDLGTSLISGEYSNTELARIWKKVIETEKPQIGNMVNYAPDNKQLLFMATPIFNKNELIGVLAIKISSKQINKLLKLDSFNKITGVINIFEKLDDGKIYLVNDIGNIRKSGDTVSGKLLNKAFFGKSGIGEKLDKKGHHRLVAYVPLKIKDLNWIILSTIDKIIINKKIIEMRNIIFKIGIPAMLIAVLIAIILSRIIVNPIKKTIVFADKIAKGNYNEKLDINQKDEIGILADSLRNMLNSFKRSVDYAEKIASGNLQSSGLDKNNYTSLEIALSSMKEKLNDIIKVVSNSSSDISIGSKELTSAINKIAEGANEQAASAEEIASSIEQMVATINQNAINAKNAERKATQSATGIKIGQKSFESTMLALSKIAKKIVQISEIAEKTDILAINAAIESNRAGEQGKGFSVIASEIRKLAESSQKAAIEIENVVTESVEAGQTAAHLLLEIVPEVEKTAELIKEVSLASNEQNVGANQINNAVQGLTIVTQQNTQISEEILQNSNELARQSEYLRNSILFFKTNKEKLEDNEEIKIEEEKFKEKISKDSKEISGAEILLNETEIDKEDDFEQF